MTTGAASGAASSGVASSGVASEIAEELGTSGASGACEARGTSADGSVSAGFSGDGAAPVLAGVALSGAALSGAASGAAGARGVPAAAEAALSASSAVSGSSAAPGKLRTPVLPADSAETDLLGIAGIPAWKKKPGRSSREAFFDAETQASAPTSVPEARPARSWEVLVPWSAIEALAKERTPVAARPSRFSLGEKGHRNRPSALDVAFAPWIPANPGGTAEASPPAMLRSQTRSAQSGRGDSHSDSPTPLNPASQRGSAARPQSSARVRSSAERDSPPQPEPKPVTPVTPSEPPVPLRPEAPSGSWAEPDPEEPPDSPLTPPT